MPADWYTVPPEYGGRGLRLRRRLYFEWTWRRHGRAGLDRIIARSTERLACTFAEIGQATERAAAEMNKAFDALAELLEDTDAKRR